MLRKKQAGVRQAVPPAVKLGPWPEHLRMGFMEELPVFAEKLKPENKLKGKFIQG